MNIQDWFPLGNGLVGTPCSPRDSQETSSTSQFKSIDSLALSFLDVQLSHPHMNTRKTIALTRWTFFSKVMSLCFNMLSRLAIPTPVLLPGKSLVRRSLVGRSPWGREVGYDLATSLSLFTFMHWRKKWQPTPVFLPGESQGWGSLVGCHLWGHTESDTTEAT